MSLNYVQVAEEEGEEPIEVPCEEDGTLLLTTLAAQFPGTCGLKYRNPATGTMRGVRVSDGKLLPPPGSGWDDSLYICVFPKVTENKRKSCDQLENSSAKTKRMETKHKCSDLIVLGLPWKTTEQELRQYFESFGEVLMAQVKKDPKTGSSKGFGFIRFSNYESQARALSKRHLIDGRWCDVRIPNSKDGQVAELNRKVFIGRCTEDITADDLEEYFSKYGEDRLIRSHPKTSFVPKMQSSSNTRKRTRNKNHTKITTTKNSTDLSTVHIKSEPIYLRPSPLTVQTNYFKSYLNHNIKLKNPVFDSVAGNNNNTTIVPKDVSISNNGFASCIGTSMNRTSSKEIFRHMIEGKSSDQDSKIQAAGSNCRTVSTSHERSADLRNLASRDTSSFSVPDLTETNILTPFTPKLYGEKSVDASASFKSLAFTNKDKSESKETSMKEEIANVRINLSESETISLVISRYFSPPTEPGPKDCQQYVERNCKNVIDNEPSIVFQKQISFDAANEKLPLYKRKLDLPEPTNAKVTRLDESMDVDEDLVSDPVIVKLGKIQPAQDNKPPPPSHEYLFSRYREDISNEYSPLSPTSSPIATEYNSPNIRNEGKENELPNPLWNPNSRELVTMMKPLQLLNNDDSSRDASPSLREREERKKRLVMELDIDNGPLSPALPLGSISNDNGTGSLKTVSSEHYGVLKNQNEFSNFSDSSFSSKASNIEISDSNKSSSAILQRTKKIGCKLITLGTPLISRHSTYTKLPNYDNFSKDVMSHMNFENLPNSTGAYLRIKKVLKDKLNSMVRGN